MNVLTQSRRARFGLVCVAAALAFNHTLLASPGWLAALPAYPLVLLARGLEPQDPGLAVTFQYLATAWGRLLWLPVLLGGTVCGLRARDFGIYKGRWKEALAATLVMWAAIELVLAAASALWNGPAWKPIPGRHSAAAMAAGVVYYFFGVALFEEAFYRGFLVPQLFHAFRTRFARQAAVLLAVLVSQLFFALAHLPHYRVPLPVPLGLTVLWLTGVLLALMWLRTGNLLVGVGWHGLLDLPYHLTGAPPGWPEGAAYLVGLLVLAAWPLVRGRAR